MTINEEFTDCFLPVCHCEFSEHWQIDPQGRLFCLKCKVYPTLQAIPQGKIDGHKTHMMRGYFLKVQPQMFNDTILELKERYAANKSAEDRTVDGDFDGLKHLFKPTEGNQPDKKRQSKSRRNKNSESDSDVGDDKG